MEKGQIGEKRCTRIEYCCGMSNCRWVVIAEDCFENLKKLAQSEGATLEPENQSINRTPPLPTAPLTEPIPSSESNKPLIEKQESTPSQEQESTPALVEEPSSTSVNRNPDPRWTSDLPPTYRKEASKFLQQLIETGEFSISEEGNIILENKPLDYNVSDFLRTTNVPYNSSKLPFQVQEWLRKQGIDKFRNHLLTMPPKWENVYSWRKSTMENRLGPSVAQKPSTRGHRKKDTHTSRSKTLKTF